MASGSLFIEPYMNWFRKTTDAPPAFGEAGALMCLSTISLGRRWLTGTEKLHPNLFLMIVGPSSVARKSTAVKRARLIVSHVADDLIGPTDYTPESLFKRLTLKDEVTGKPRSKMTLFANEYGADLARSAAYGPTMQADFCALYDCDRIEKVRVRSGPVTVEKPRVSLFAAAAYEMLREHIAPQNWSTGFMMRFLFVGPVGQRVIFDTEPPAAPAEMQTTVAALTSLRDTLRVGQGGGLDFDAHGLAAFKHYSSVFMAKPGTANQHLTQMYVERMRTTFRKLCLIYQIDIDPHAPVGPDAVFRAFYFIETVCWPHFLETYEITTQRDFDSVSQVLIGELRRAGPNGLLRSNVTLRFNSSRIVNDVVDWLKKARLVSSSGGTVGDELLTWRAK